VEARDFQRDAREGQARPTGVTDRLVVPMKPVNAGGGKGPEFKTDVRQSMRTRRLA
jgi:hypothetical protein